MSATRHFTLHGVSIFATAATSSLDNAAWTLLRSVAVEHPPALSDTSIPPDAISLRLCAATSADAPPPSARLWLAADPLRLLTDGHDSFLLLDNQLVGTCSPRDRRICVWAPQPLERHPDIIGQMIVLPLLLETLREYGFVSLHAAALAHGDRAVLFPAETGAGKTTLTLALLRAGFRLLSDDCPLLRRTETGVVAHAFAEPLHVFPNVQHFFPEVVPPAYEDLEAAPIAKVAVDPIQVYGDCVIEQCMPGAIVFPSISDGDSTWLEPLDTSSALLRLLALAMPSASRAHLRCQFDLLGDLASAVSCYTMHTGRDFECLPDRIRAILQSHEPGETA